MKPAKYSAKETTTIDQGTKIIYKYPSPTKDFDIGRVVVNGRHPSTKNTFIIEDRCSFVIYVLSGSGQVYAADDVFEVSKSDVVFVPNNSKFAVIGSLEYITVDVPAYYKEQSSEVNI